MGEAGPDPDPVAFEGVDLSEGRNKNEIKKGEMMMK